jgi:hypothetical protein
LKNVIKSLSLNGTLRALIEPPNTPERLSLTYILHQLDDRARGVLIILFAIPNCLPGLPGTSAVTGLPLLFLCVQMALSRPPWLPRFLSDRTVSKDWLVRALDKAQPWILRVEKLIHPRLSILTDGPAERLVGILGSVLAFTIMLPIPLGNTLPAVALVFLSFGLIGRDGVWILAGLFVSGMAAALLALAGWAAFQSILFLWMQWFGLS